jgi:hypothetical protein
LAKIQQGQYRGYCQRESNFAHFILHQGFDVEAFSKGRARHRTGNRLWQFVTDGTIDVLKPR